MATAHGFEHLPLIRREEGKARYQPPRFAETQVTKANRANRSGHSSALGGQVTAITANWQARLAARAQAGLPPIEKGIPLLLKIDPTLDIDDLRHFFGFEIIAEQEDEFVIVASEDESLQYFQNKLNDFVSSVKGSGEIAKIHTIEQDLNSDQRLKRILSERLYTEFPQLNTDDPYLVDISISCQGNWVLKKKPKRGRLTDKTWAKKEAEWSQIRLAAYDQWDVLKDSRLATVQTFITAYRGEIKQDTAPNSDAPPDYFELRVRLPARGLKDLILNHPFIFEVNEPDDIELPQQHSRQLRDLKTELTILAPDADAPVVCVIDSGIQEEHVLLDPAIDKETSRCFLPQTPSTDVADYVAAGGHGTRVAGAVLYRDDIPVSGGTAQTPFWVQNARVLNANCDLPKELLPPALMRDVVAHFHQGPRKTRIFNH